MTRQEELEGSSEFELNCALARTLGIKIPAGWKDDNYFIQSHNMLFSTDGSLAREVIVKDYCNNPADIMPLVVGLDITITFNTIDHNEREGVFVRYNRRPLPHYEAFNENLYRALVIVLILVKESEL